MEQLNKLRTLPVSDVMNKNIISIEGSSTVAEAIRKMKDSSVTTLVVPPRNEDDTYGLLTESDILEKVIDPGEDIYKNPWNTQVHVVMTKPVVSVYPQMRIKYAIRMMKNLNIRLLAVMDGSKMVGVLSETDILHAVETLPVTEKSAL